MAVLGESETNTEPLGVYGAVTLLAGALLLAVALNGILLILPIAYVAAVCLLFSRGSFRDLRQLKMLVPAVIVVSTLLWQEEYDALSAIAGLGVSPFISGFLVGVEMSARAVVIVLAVSAFVRTVRISELTSLLESVTRSKSFSFVFGLAFNIRPYLEGISRDTYNAIKMRGGFRLANVASSTKYLLSSTTLNALEKCQDISHAAEVRAFGSARLVCSAPEDRPTFSITDFIMVIATVAVVVLSFVLKM